MTIALEHIQDADWPAVNRVVDTLRSLVLDTGGVSLGIRVGLANTPPTSPATADTQAATIQHGLGRTPLVVVGTVAGGAFAAALSPKTTNLTSTSFDLRVSSNISITFTVGVYWVAIG